MIGTVATLLAMLLAGPDQTDRRDPHADVGPWSITRLDNSCSMIAAFEGGSFVHVRYDARLGEAILSIADPAFQSVAEGETYQLDVSFQSADRQQTYSDVKFVGGQLPAPNRMVTTIFEAPPFLDQLSTYEGLRVTRGSATVASTSLNGTAPAVDALRRCADEVARTNPSDPFAR
ncbi:hypothetical protein ACX0GZ_04275 [Sphingomonas aestuarii]